MIADIVVIGLVTVFIISGWKSGLIKSLVGLLALFISLISAYFLYPTVAELLFKTQLNTILSDMVSDNFMELLLNTNGRFAQFFAEYLSWENISDILNPVSVIVGVLIDMISFVIVFIVSRFVLWIVCRALDVVAKLPVLKQFNKLGGMLVGAVKGVLAVYIVLAIMVVAVPFEESGRLVENLESSRIARVMYENNILLNIIGKGDAKL